MNADPDKKLRRRTVKTRSRFTTLLTVYFFAALIIPNCVLANTGSPIRCGLSRR
mgnify:CR=1 FL=1